jgi:DNA polymerase-1
VRPILALPDVKTGLDTHGITWIEIGDAEADDVIATLAAAHPGREVLIASMDQDYYQLVRDPSPDHAAVRVLNTAMRPGTRLIGPAEVTARYGITPGQYDFRALCGDASDNIPGVRGVGAKTAAALLAGGLVLEDMPASGRLSGSKGAANRGDLAAGADLAVDDPPAKGSAANHRAGRRAYYAAACPGRGHRPARAMAAHHLRGRSRDGCRARDPVRSKWA